MENDTPLAAESLDPDDQAPYGYILDKGTGERRPKKLPGRPRVAKDDEGGTSATRMPPSIEELKAKASPSKGVAAEDRAPGRDKVRGFKGRKAKAEPADVPPFRAGPIAKGVNKLYSQAGRIVRAMDYDIGTAILATTRKESPDDVTVGEAWEELARVNPRIRAFLLKLITGGAWGQLFMAHMPILLAVVMKDGIRSRLPFGRLMDSMLEPEDDGEPSDLSSAFGGMNGEDVAQMMAMAQAMMGNIASQVPRTQEPPRRVVLDEGFDDGPVDIQ